MFMSAPETQNGQGRQSVAVLELLVKNHPGVMSHVCGLFSRRAYNLEGIAVLPVGDGSLSRIWLKVAEESRLEQIVKQLQKLPDIRQVDRHEGAHSVFTEMAHYFTL